MSTPKQDTPDWLIFLLLLASVPGILGGFLWYAPTKEWTSDYWKTEIVRRGYGTWETTPDGQVWFKWKDDNAQP